LIERAALLLFVDSPPVHVKRVDCPSPALLLLILSLIVNVPVVQQQWQQWQQQQLQLVK
jgi:hypothetical protein